MTPSERRELRDRLRSRTLPAEDVRRARLILLLAQGKSYLAIRQVLGCNPNYISRWKARFEAERLAGLYSHHPGRAVEKRTPALEAKILQWTRRPAPDGSTHWSSRKLAQHLGMSHMMVARVWQRAGLKPHRVERYARVPPASDEFTSSDLSNLLGFAGGLEAIGSLLESRERPPSSATAEPTSAEADPGPHPFLDPVAFRFSVKLGAAITLGLLVGLTTQRADLQTILWSTVVAGQPNQYGAVVRKTLLRLAGCVLGGLAALAAMILVSENFDSLPPYLVVIFAVTMFSTYIAQSSEWLAYAGIQAGITFLICYVGLAPASDVYRPLWRFWGIILGVLTSGFVFLLLWPEYASDKLLERLRRLMRTTLAFATEVAQGSITEGRIATVEMRLNADLMDVLTMADQARFEGRRGAANSAAAIQVAAIIIRIAYRFGIIARGRLSGSEALLPNNVLHRLAAVEETFCTAFGTALRRFELAVPFERPDSSSQAPLQPAVDLEPSIDELAAVAALEGRDWSSESRSVFVTQLESYRRLAILLGSLNVTLSNFAVVLHLPHARHDHVSRPCRNC